MYETSCQSRFNARYWMLGAGALGRPRGMVWEWRREEGSGWGTHVYLWRIHFNIWQNQYNIVRFKNKIKLKKINKHDFAPIPSCWGFSFALGHGVSFFGGMQHSPVDSCSAASCSFVILTGEDESMSFYSTILCHTLLWVMLSNCMLFKSEDTIQEY